jgi:UDP-N-acetyl-D-glucosamine dehydrogenase
MEHSEILAAKIRENREVIGIVGLGYVGLPLAVSFSNAGVRTIGFDKSAERVSKINTGQNYIADICPSELQSVVSMGILEATTDFSRIKECDAVMICVPTPLDVFRKPDMGPVQEACAGIARNMKPDTFICLESTTFPTTTEEFILPLLERESGMVHGRDFWLAFSPERIDPGNQEYNTVNTPKIIGALSEEGLKIGCSVYGKCIRNIFPVSSPKVAEMVKILENTYRLVNISLINELALLCGKMDINIWEVIEAAKTKPFGFQAFYPGPGIGGHCIPLDPFYLEHIAQKYNFDLSMIHTAGHINLMMAHRMTLKITSALNRVQKPVNGSRIFFLGVAYKPGIDDDRESPALKIMDEVIKKGGIVSYHDPYIPEARTPEGISFKSVGMFPELKEADCVVITTHHPEFEQDMILQHARLIVDLRNLITKPSSRVYKL